MTCHMLKRVMLSNHGQQRHQTFVLFFGECVDFCSFEFDTDGKVIALLTASMCGHARMPGTVIATDKLQQLAATANKKVR